jgi:hypothetical protein
MRPTGTPATTSTWRRNSARVSSPAIRPDGSTASRPNTPTSAQRSTTSPPKRPARHAPVGPIVEPDPELLGDLLEAAAAIATIRGKPFHAAALWGAADMTSTQIGRVEPAGAVPVRTKWLPVAMQDAGDGQAWDAARTAGIELSQEEALHLAAEQTTPSVTDVLG